MHWPCECSSTTCEFYHESPLVHASAHSESIFISDSDSDTSEDDAPSHPSPKFRPRIQSKIGSRASSAPTSPESGCHQYEPFLSPTNAHPLSADCDVFISPPIWDVSEPYLAPTSEKQSSLQATLSTPSSNSYEPRHSQTPHRSKSNFMSFLRSVLPSSNRRKKSQPKTSIDAPRCPDTVSDGDGILDRESTVMNPSLRISARTLSPLFLLRETTTLNRFARSWPVCLAAVGHCRFRTHSNFTGNWDTIEAKCQSEMHTIPSQTSHLTVSLGGLSTHHLQFSGFTSSGNGRSSAVPKDPDPENRHRKQASPSDEGDFCRFTGACAPHLFSRSRNIKPQLRTTRGKRFGMQFVWFFCRTFCAISWRIDWCSFESHNSYGPHLKVLPTDECSDRCEHVGVDFFGKWDGFETHMVK